MITFSFITLILYSITFLILVLFCFKVKTISKNQDQVTKFSILIPFKNELENLPKLLESINQLNYDFSKFEVILIDDNDDDKCKINLVNLKFETRIILNKRTTNSPKKDALTLGVNLAKFTFIITADADCEVPENWLQNYNNYLSQNTDKELVIGQVKIKNNNSLLQIFQAIEFDVLQAITMGSYAVNQAFMCNGANLCFTKNIFNKVNGYHGNTHIASGDDVFLLQKVKSFQSKSIGFCKANDKVITLPVSSWKSLFYQRLRWASKTVAYNSFFAKYIAVLVFFTQLICVFSFVYLIFIHFNKTLFSLLILKYLIHLLLLFKIQKFTLRTLIYSLLFEIYYVFFSLLIVFSSLFQLKIKWK
jgi:cellulose synthase/poly-beta-1,6-N-acetylglucosamine synthase-like glycosyltransferase